MTFLIGGDEKPNISRVFGASVVHRAVYMATKEIQKWNNEL